MTPSPPTVERQTPPAKAPAVIPGTDYTVQHEPEYASGPIDVTTLFNRGNKEPDLPCHLRTRYPDRVWRWMGKSMVDKLGMRGYTAYSVSTKEKTEIDRGQTPGVRVTESNLIWWNEDSFLGWKPRRWFEQSQAQKRALIDDQTQRSRPEHIPGAQGRTPMSSLSVTSTEGPLER